MSDQRRWTSDARETVVSAIGGVAGAVADPREGLRRLAASLLSPKPLVVGAGLALAYVLGWRCGRRTASR